MDDVLVDEADVSDSVVLYTDDNDDTVVVIVLVEIDSSVYEV